MKEYFDKKYNANWHCIVGKLLDYNIFIGKNFYSSFSHEAGTHIFFYIGQIAVLLYKLG
jgi:dynein light chain LC8-type